MDVRRATLIPAGINRGERRQPAGVGRLNAAQIGQLALAAILRIVAIRVALPDVDGGPGYRCAGVVHVDDGDGQRDGEARFAFADVAADEIGQ